MWWKILGVVLFLYVLIGGLITPLKPGLESVEPSNLKAGSQIKIELQGYNTNFLNQVNHVWLKQGEDQYVKANSVNPNNENGLIAEMSLPNNIEEGSHTLIVYNEKDGPIVLPDGVFVVANPNKDSMNSAQFSTSLGMNINQSKGIKFPYRSILNETIRNTFFHVALWMAMFVLYIVGLIYAIQYLRTKDMTYDMKSAAFNKSGILYGILGIITGSLWARYTWGSWWTNDVKLNMSTIAMFIYFGYILLRNSFSDEEKKARISSVFSIFAFVTLIPLVFVLPRMQDSLHPGNGGNPALGGEDLDHTLRLFFYPSIIALILLGTWMAQLKFRADVLAKKVNEN
jgi:heme exporter protein C